jgi:hypothetical protein
MSRKDHQSPAKGYNTSLLARPLTATDASESPPPPYRAHPVSLSLPPSLQVLLDNFMEGEARPGPRHRSGLESAFPASRDASCQQGRRPIKRAGGGCPRTRNGSRGPRPARMLLAVGAADRGGERRRRERRSDVSFYLSIYIYIFTCPCMYVCMYVCSMWRGEREREREREREGRMREERETAATFKEKAATRQQELQQHGKGVDGRRAFTHARTHAHARARARTRSLARAHNEPTSPNGPASLCESLTRTATARPPSRPPADTDVRARARARAPTKQADARAAHAR